MRNTTGLTPAQIAGMLAYPTCSISAGQEVARWVT